MQSGPPPPHGVLTLRSKVCATHSLCIGVYWCLVSTGVVSCDVMSLGAVLHGLKKNTRFFNN